MAISYTTLGSTVSIEASGFVPASGLNSSVAIVGGYNSAEAAADVTEGEASVVVGSAEARDMFGPDSELARQSAAAFANGASEVYGVAVPETDTTETFGSSTATSSGTISDDGLVDPRFNPEHDIVVTDVGAGVDLDVSYVYGAPQAPSGTDEVNINPHTGDWEADSESEYEFSYTTAEYADAINAASSEVVRAVAVCDEGASAKSATLTSMSEAESNIRFLRAVYGAEPNIQSADISSYTPSQEDWRIVETAPAHGSDGTGPLRTCGAIAGLIASQPIDVSGSITYDVVNYLTSLNVEYTPQEASEFEAVTAITDEGEVAEGVTTSSEPSFRDIYKVEIVDLIVENLYSLVKDYKGGSNAETARRLFENRIKRALSSYSVPNAQPPLLASGDGSQPYVVSSSLGANDNETNVTIGIEVAPIAKQVNLNFNLGPVEFAGATTQ